MSWLESELSSLFGLDCASIATHTPLAQFIRQSSLLTTGNDNMTLEASSSPIVDHRPSDESSLPGRGQTPSTQPDASDIGLLALNATGELRYLGPSSGSFLFNATSSLLRASGANRNPGPARHLRSQEDSTEATPARQRTSQSSRLIAELSPEAIDVLLSSFKMWIQPLYPLLNDEELSQIQEKASSLPAGKQYPEAIHTSLIMALGAVNLSHTAKEQQAVAIDYSRLPTASAFYEEAVGLFEACSQAFRPSPSLITTLLLFCIYSSYAATKDTQWQLAGISMRVSELCSLID